MHRFFISHDSFKNGAIYLIGENAAHAQVLRLRTGEEIVATISGSGIEHICRILAVSKVEVVAEIMHSRAVKSEPPFEIVLYQALPKGSKMAEIIERATELGVTRIVPIITARCVSLPKSDSQKSARWQKIAKVAAKLSHRGRIPEISDTIRLDKALQTVTNPSAAFVCYELEGKRSLKQHLDKLEPNKLDSLAFFIGAEGGFEAHEIELFSQQGISPISLGARILRTESAAAMVLANINYAIGETNK